MTSARDEILGKLRASLSGKLPFPDTPAVPGGDPLPVTRLDPGEDLATRFCAEVERVKGQVMRVADEAAARAAVVQLLHDRGVARATWWDDAHVPLADLSAFLDGIGITRVSGDNAMVETAQAGITGCDAAIAATGTIVLTSGPGRSRMASLLPPLHIAIVRESQLIPRLEDWVATQYADGLRTLRAASNITLITGCSRTADIEMSPVFGVHGPLEFVVVLIPV
jgi:L-lactate dehydrogenase complex protein LldG